MADVEPRSLAALIVDLWEGAALRAKAARDGAPVDAAIVFIVASLSGGRVD
ncbi:TetR family transcriptional regulator C-terminal domain-containing protein [Micromonospora sp. CB01531]|uniref:TetR family transcriptional regulator C-terminal domain-containing protein n=1 Tax=Micromonospora sp. CB01531 TaxID=1718947 RepID=UPI0009FA6C4E